MIIQKVQGVGSRFDTYVGKRISLHCTATGKVLLAHASPANRKLVLSRTVFTRHTRHTITSNIQLEKVLDLVRQVGYAADDEEEELGARCLAVPVRGVASECVAALSVSGAVDELLLTPGSTVIQRSLKQRLPFTSRFSSTTFSLRSGRAWTPLRTIRGFAPVGWPRVLEDLVSFGQRSEE